MVNELELKLVTANNKTQRAEGRCTEALQEIEKMKVSRRNAHATACKGQLLNRNGRPVESPDHWLHSRLIRSLTQCSTLSIHHPIV